MSIPGRKLSLLQRHAARRRLTRNSTEPLFQPFSHNHRTFPHAATLATLSTPLHAHVNSTRLSTDSSSSSISFSASIRRVPRKDQIGWREFSTQTDDIIDNSKWLIPRKGTGFDSFLKRDKNDDVEKDEEKSTVEDDSEKGGEPESEDDPVKNGGGGEANEKKEDGDVFGSFRSKYSDNNTRNNSEGGNGGNGIPPNFTGNTILLSLLLVGLSYFLIRNDDDSASPTDFSREITWNDFCNYLLETGQVEKIVVTNNRTIAKVFLKRGSHGLPQHQNRQFRYLDQRRQKGSANQMFDESTTHIQDGYSSGPSDSFDSMQNLPNGKSNQHQIVYRFAIGSVESFEKKLEEAQKAVGVDPLDEIPVQYTNESTTKSEVLGVLPSLFLMGAAFYFMRFAAGSMGGMGGSGRGGGGIGGMFQVGKSTHKKIKPEDVKVNFSSVAGCEEAKREIVEFVDFLQSPEQFTKLGAKIPKGALLCGPPGTGKTLLAKAVAGEAGVPFFFHQRFRFHRNVCWCWAIASP